MRRERPTYMPAMLGLLVVLGLLGAATAPADTTRAAQASAPPSHAVTITLP
jgi:hypothetical protein